MYYFIFFMTDKFPTVVISGSGFQTGKFLVEAAKALSSELSQT